MAGRVRSGDAYVECPTMTLAAIALDYDGTIAVNDAMDPGCEQRLARLVCGDSRRAGRYTDCCGCHEAPSPVVS